MEHLDDLVRSFRRDLRSEDRAPKTCRTYCDAITEFGRWLETQERVPELGELTRDNIRDWLISLKDRGYADATRASKFAAMRRFCRWLVAEEFIPKSPMNGLRQPVAKAPVVPVLGEPELKALIGACSGTGFLERRDEALLRLMADTGCRVSEITGLKLADIDLDEGVALVTGKGSRPRAVPFGNRTARSLDRYLRLRKVHPRSDETAAVFLGQRGAMTVDGIAERLDVRARQAGLGHLHPHQLRHSFAHAMLAAGMQEQDLMRLAGWRSRTMLGRYGAALGEERALGAHRRLGLGDRI